MRKVFRRIALGTSSGSAAFMVRVVAVRKNFSGRIQRGFLIGSFVCGTLFAQIVAPSNQNQSTKPGTPVHATLNRPPRRVHLYYEGFWGVDSLKVKTAESGEIIRFSWRVLDPEKAAALDKKIEPSLIDPQAGVQLVVPTLEKIGQLRQSSTPEAGKTYGIAFSNSGRTVEHGDPVDIVTGQFRAPGLVVE